VTSAVALVGAVGVAVSAGIMIFAAARKKESAEPWLLRVPLAILVVGVLSGLTSAYALLLRYAFNADDFSLPSTSGSSPVLVAATLVGGALAAAYAVLRLRAHLVAELKGRIDAHGDARADDKHRHDLEVALIERFAKGVELLASESSISRIAGAHLIFAVGDEWASGAQRCLDVLVSHLRGLNKTDSLEARMDLAHDIREEIRLITSEILLRLPSKQHGWDVRAGDFRGAILGDVNLSGIHGLPVADFRDTRILGDLSLQADSASESPKLSGLTCEGDLVLVWNSPRVAAPGSQSAEIDLGSAVVGGAVDFSGERLDRAVNATGLRVGSDLSLAFEEFGHSVVLDSVQVGGEIRIGSTALSATFGTEQEPLSVSLQEAAFAKFTLRNFTLAPRLDLSGAAGRVDLSESRFPFEVIANRLDASAGLTLRKSRFEAALVLDGAEIAAPIDMEGMSLSNSARSGIESSDFPLREHILASSVSSLRVNATPDVAFRWREVIMSPNVAINDGLRNELERRLEEIGADLPLDWQQKPAFTARVMSAVARAAAKHGQTDDVVRVVQSLLRTSLGLATDGESRLSAPHAGGSAAPRQGGADERLQ
jgi:hypothetical protein